MAFPLAVCWRSTAILVLKSPGCKYLGLETKQAVNINIFNSRPALTNETADILTVYDADGIYTVSGQFESPRQHAVRARISEARQLNSESKFFCREADDLTAIMTVSPSYVNCELTFYVDILRLNMSMTTRQGCQCNRAEFHASIPCLALPMCHRTLTQTWEGTGMYTIIFLQKTR